MILEILLLSSVSPDAISRNSYSFYGRMLGRTDQPLFESSLSLARCKCFSNFIEARQLQQSIIESTDRHQSAKSYEPSVAPSPYLVRWIGFRQVAHDLSGPLISIHGLELRLPRFRLLHHGQSTRHNSVYGVRWQSSLLALVGFDVASYTSCKERNNLYTEWL